MKNPILKKIKNIDAEFGTPTYVYSVDAMQQQYEKIRKQLIPYCDVYYSMKANPLLGICQYFSKKQLGCEVASKNELLTALNAGFLKNKIIFAGPGKTDEDLKHCVKNHIRAVICESIEEIIRVNKIAQAFQHVMPVMIRINPRFQIKNAPIKMSGVPTQFGIDVAELEKNLKKINSCQHIRLIGMQIYNGSRILDYTAVLENVQNILKLAANLSSSYQIEWEYIDIGGGLGVRYFEGENDFDVQQFIPGLNRLLQQYKKNNPKIRFIIELGRYLVAESGLLLAKVLATKTNHGKNYAIVNAGMHCLFSATGLNSFVQRNYLSSHYPRRLNITADQSLIYQIAGPLCTPGDLLLRDKAFQKIYPGDFIVFHHVGAYGYTASPNRFLSHDMPAEILWHNQRLYLARQRESYREIVQTQKDLSFLF